MPVEINHPGVYVEELPSAGHGIAPVATSIAAFVGRTLCGPVERPADIFSFGDFQRWFGGLAVDYPLSYAVQQFFANGGTQAQICRLFERGARGDGCARLSLATPAAPLGLVSANPGAWGNRLSASVDTNGITASTAAPFIQYGLGQNDLFNLTLILADADGRTMASEQYRNLAVADRAGSAPFPDRIDRMLESESMLARVDTLSVTPPTVQSVGSDGGGNDSVPLSPATMIGDEEARTGLYALGESNLFNLLCVPPDGRIGPGSDQTGQDLDLAVRQTAARYCAERRAIFLVDPPAAWQDMAMAGKIASIDPASLGLRGASSRGSPIARNAAVYFPCIVAEDILDHGRSAVFAPCGAVAGIIAATDTARGVWKAPAGQQAGIAGIIGLETKLGDTDNGLLNPLGINCLRSFPVIGSVIWGARTLQGADTLADDYKYLPVRRLVLFIEESLWRGTRWAAFEASAEPLWSSLRLQISAFLADLARQGALYSYAVTCDATTTTQADVDEGVVNILVQIAPEKPAEFLAIQIQQRTVAVGGQ